MHIKVSEKRKKKIFSFKIFNKSNLKTYQLIRLHINE